MLNINGFIVVLAITSPGVTSINIFNGKYRNVNVVIQNTVAENDILIDRIKQVFTNASQLLFEATRHQVYFGKINIIIPNTWSSKPEYDKIPALSKLNTYITVDDRKVKAPHTKRKRKKCGSPGRYIYLPASFLLEEGKTKYGYHENVVVHEWGHLRWGLWDEYGTKKNGRLYLDAGEWKPVRCSESITGKVGRGSQCTRGTSKCDTSDTEKLINETCKFCPDESQSLSSMSSIMAFNWLDEVVTFCDNENNTSVAVHQRHNSKAPNKQNLKCNGRSSWEVMRDHKDFQPVNALPASTNTIPTFTIKQETVGYRVFVLDVSGSMDVVTFGTSRLTKMNQASSYIIQEKIPDYSWLGIVWFATTAHSVRDMTQVKTPEDRNDLISALPQLASGSTCIGCGINAGLAYLTSKLGDPAGSELIVISDGKNNQGHLDSAIQNAIDSGVIIHSISVSQNADPKMIYMATATGGDHISYLEVGTISITSAFMEILSSAVSSSATESVTVVSEQFPSLSSNNIQASFDIDSSIGNSTYVSILQGASAALRVDITNPNGTVYTKSTTDTHVVLDIPGTAMTGRYNVTIEAATSSLELYVTSSPTGSEAVRVTSWISPIDFDYSSGELPVVEAEVTKGMAAVLDAIVTALIETSAINSCEVSLLDDGADPDDTSDDGVYAGVIPAFCIANGRVSAKVYVKGENGTAHAADVLSGAGSPDSDDDETIDEVLQDDFQRQSVSNEILVNNYVVGDVTSPGRITDVSIIDIYTENTPFGESRNFTITWTATGDDVNIGQAMEYEIRISSDINILTNDFSNAELLSVSNANFTPKAAGIKEYIRIEVDAEESYTATKFFAIRAKDEVGNVGAVSNIISILVANGYRISVEGDIVYSYRYIDGGASNEAIVEKEKKKNLTILAVGLSCAAAVIVIAITALTLCIKKAKAKEIVEDCEFGSRASTTTVFSIEQPLKDFFSVKPARPTVSKKVFKSSQLETIPEKEQNWTASFSPTPITTLSQDKRKPFDIISQNSCNIDMLSEHSLNLEGNGLENDSRSLCFGLSQIGNSCENILTAEVSEKLESDFLPGEVIIKQQSQMELENERNEVGTTQTAHPNNLYVHADSAAKGTNDNKNKCEFLATLSGLPDNTVTKLKDDRESLENFFVADGASTAHDIEKSKPKRFKFERQEEYFDEDATANPLGGFPVLNSDEISREMSKMYESMIKQQSYA